MKRLLMTLLATTIATASCHALEITPFKKQKNAILLSGEFVVGDAKKVENYIDRNPHITDIALSSDGGVLSAGIKLGVLIDDLKLTTHVMKGDRCLSACSLAYIGGASQSLQGTLGFHNVQAGKLIEQSKNQLFSDGQSLGTFYAWHIVSMGYHIQLADIVNRQTNGNTFVVFTDKKDLDLFYVGPVDKTPLKRYMGNFPVGQSKVNSLIKRLSQ